MNIFYLSSNPKQAAQYHLDKHVIKMILESAQLLCTAHRMLDGKLQTQTKTTKTGKTRRVKRYVLENQELENKMYNATHIHHPCAVWARENINNYMWLYELFVALCDEYTHRYGKIHKTDSLMRACLKQAPVNIANTPFTEPAQAMPNQYKHADPVVAYRQYYLGEKSKFARWTRQAVPEWFVHPTKNNAGVTDANV